MQIWDTRSMKELSNFSGGTAPINCAAWHPVHEELFVSGDHEGNIRYWLSSRKGPQVQFLPKISSIEDDQVRITWESVWGGQILSLIQPATCQSVSEDFLGRITSVLHSRQLGHRWTSLFFSYMLKIGVKTRQREATLKADTINSSIIVTDMTFFCKTDKQKSGVV